MTTRLEGKIGTTNYNATLVSISPRKGLRSIEVLCGLPVNCARIAVPTVSIPAHSGHPEIVMPMPAWRRDQRREGIEQSSGVSSRLTLPPGPGFTLA